MVEVFWHCFAYSQDTSTKDIYPIIVYVKNFGTNTHRKNTNNRQNNNTNFCLSEFTILKQQMIDLIYKWMPTIGRPFLITLLAYFFIGTFSTPLNAQVVLPKAQGMGVDTCKSVKLETCGGSVSTDDLRWTDDGLNDGNYADPVGFPRTDTIEFCPKDQWHRVKVVFTDFDIAAGDTLNYYQGNKAAVRLALTGTGSGVGTGTGSGVGIFTGTGTGTGVSRAFGGWVDAFCSPVLNPSGCLTFILRTNGDNRKGAGWDAWVDCEERKLEVVSVNMRNYKLKCGETCKMIDIPPATFSACGAPLVTNVNDQIIRIKDQHGNTVFQYVSTNAQRPPTPTSVGKYNFGIGVYFIEYKLLADSTKVLTVPFAVQGPSLVGNDDINIPLGASCAATIIPDHTLENPCDTIFKTLYYDVTVTIPGAHGFKDVVIKSRNVLDTLNPVIYPTVTAEDIHRAGHKICDVTATIKVDRIYYPFQKPAKIDFYSGIQTASVETKARFLDQQKPWIDLQAICDTLIACDTTGLARLLNVKAIDNCDTSVAVQYSIRYTETDPCFANLGSPDTTQIMVDFTATDDCGNVGRVTKPITMIRPDLSNPAFVVKTPNVTVDCNENAVAPKPGVRIGCWKNGQLDPQTIDTVTLSTEEYVCGYILVETEENIPTTDCGSKKYVYYSILDWCNSARGISAIDTSFIEYTDTIAPVFNEGQGQPLTVELDHFSCTYDINQLQKPKASDDCDATPTVKIDRIVRIKHGKKDIVIPASHYEKLECDSFEIRWLAADDCHEQLKNDTLNQIVVIQDVTAPSANCVDQLNVSISNDWGGRIYVDDVDAGSYDACGIVSRLIRIKGSGDEFAEFVTIGCEYVHPDLQIELQVKDKKGNANLCWVDVQVEDKINPFCKPLENVVGDCEDYHTGDFGTTTDIDEDGIMDENEYIALADDLLAIFNKDFGDPQVLGICEDNLSTANCGVLEIEQEYQLLAWPCGEFKIKRRYRAKDWSGNVSSWRIQQITITAKQNWTITFPADWEGTCGEMAPAEDISLNNGACDLLAYEVTERQFEVPGDACFKIERTYHIINWCKYESGVDPVEIARIEGDHGVADSLVLTSEGNEEIGYWTYIQVLKVHDDEAPVVTIVYPDPCINGVEFDAEPYGEEDKSPGVAPYECDELKTWSAIALDCSSNISWVGRLYNANTGNLIKEVESHEITHVVSNKESYYVEFWAYDNCGNSGGLKSEPTTFWDCKKPTPYLLNGIAVELMETGMIEVWASDLNQNSFDNCTDQANLDMRIWSPSLGIDPPQDYLGVVNLGKVITFECLNEGTNTVYVYVIDEERNWDYAETYVLVQDNRNSCLGFAPRTEGMIAGKVTNQNGEDIEFVDLTISGNTEKSMTTAADGNYMFMLPTGEDYRLTPAKEINPLNGVSTLDLVLINKHILGITPFESPYDQIAADVNKSGTITAFDLVQLRQLILNIRTTFVNNSSWRFVDAAYEFTTDNPSAEPFDEFYSIENHEADIENMNFIGVKIGDVNGNARTNSFTAADTRTTHGTLTLTTTDRLVTVGETVNVAFQASNLDQIQGYQFTLNFAGNDATIIEGIAKADNFNTTLAKRGLMATSWNGEATAAAELFTISFTAEKAGLLSDLVSITDEVTTAEAYNQAGELMDIKLFFNQTATANYFDLAQNAPNPFQGETVINFILPTAGNATLKVMDAQGKVLKVIAQDFAKGANQLTLKASELSATGVLYYQLESADNLATKKMIIID